MELPLISDKEMLCASLIGKYSYRRVKDVILEACKHQRDANQLAVDKQDKIIDNLTKRVQLHCAEIIELHAKLHDCIEQRRQAISHVESLRAKLEQEHQRAQAYSDSAEWAEADLEKCKAVVNTLKTQLDDWESQCQVLEAELKEFDIRQYIPEGKFCSHDDVSGCPCLDVMEMRCHLRDTPITWGERYWDSAQYPVKCAACPKPYKEQ